VSKNENPSTPRLYGIILVASYTFSGPFEKTLTIFGVKFGVKWRGNVTPLALTEDTALHHTNLTRRIIHQVCDYNIR
jgi:hypothetical protein